MKLRIYSYRYAREILEHPNHQSAWSEITAVCAGAPIFEWEGKSKSNRNFSIVQQVMNTYFDRALSVESDWLYHPLATKITGSRLAADFRKSFPDITVQAEVQFGNMSRWYSDIFKLQTAYSQQLIQMGLCIVPVASMANRIDSNITHFERIVRELPSADLSITLPILVIGLEEDASTPRIDLKTTSLPLASITGSGKTANRYRIVNAYMDTGGVSGVDERSPTGAFPNNISSAPPDDDADEGSR